MFFNWCVITVSGVNSLKIRMYCFRRRSIFQETWRLGWCVGKAVRLYLRSTGFLFSAVVQTKWRPTWCHIHVLWRHTPILTFINTECWCGLVGTRYAWGPGFKSRPWSKLMCDLRFHLGPACICLCITINEATATWRPFTVYCLSAFYLSTSYCDLPIALLNTLRCFNTGPLNSRRSAGSRRNSLTFSST